MSSLKPLLIVAVEVVAPEIARKMISQYRTQVRKGRFPHFYFSQDLKITRELDPQCPTDIWKTCQEVSIRSRQGNGRVKIGLTGFGRAPPSFPLAGFGPP